MTADGTKPEAIDGHLFAEPLPAAADEPVRLAASRCPSCERSEFPRRTYCPLCGDDMMDERLSDQATLTGFTAVLHQPPQGLLQAPYLVGVAAFPEGLSVLGIVTGARFEDVAIGDRVAVVGLALGDKLGFAFRLLD